VLFKKKRFALKALLTSHLVKTNSKELTLMKKFNSPYLVNFIEAFHEGIMLCIVMEYCEVCIKFLKPKYSLNFY
jgi:hypothetical protein